MPGFLSGLIGGIFLSTRISKDGGQGRGEGKGSLLAVQDAREDEASALIGESDLLFFVEFVGDGCPEFDAEFTRHERLVFKIEGLFLVVDVSRVLGVPEMLGGARNELIEMVRSVRVPVDFDKGFKIVPVDGVVGRVVVNDLIVH